MSDKSTVYERSVLLSKSGFVTPMRRVPGIEGYARDGSFLICLVEELIALSASRLALLESSNDSMFVELLPEKVRQHVTVIGKSDQKKAIQFREGIFAPVLRELGCENPYSNELEVSVLSKVKGTTTEDAVQTLMYVYSEIGVFFLGMDRRLAIDLDIASLAKNTAILRRKIRDTSSIMNLASLESILNAYSHVDVPSLKSVPGASTSVTKSFQRLLEDEAYRELSQQADGLGIPGRIKRTLTLMKRSIDTVIAKPMFKHAFDVGAKGITIATQIPTAGSTITDCLGREAYLPPIVSLNSLLTTAQESWDIRQPDMILPDRFGER